jgi:hypothetical protein
MAKPLRDNEIVENLKLLADWLHHPFIPQAY